MSAPMFTPGPWQCYADLPSTDPNWHIVTGRQRTSGVIANVLIEPGNPRQAADARLITAGPELYNALTSLVDIVDRMDGDNDAEPPTEDAVLGAMAAARAALAQARGGA